MKERKSTERPKTWSDRINSAVDRVIYAFAPVAGAKRMEFRSRYDARMSAYEGARVDDTRSNWIGKNLSPDSDLEESLAELRSRSRELYRNDSIGGAIDTRVNLVVSYGFTPQAAIIPREGISDSQAKSWNDQLELLYDQVYPRISVNGQDSLWQCIRLAERHNAFDGESFTVLSDIGGADKPIPLAIEVIDPERVETPIDKTSNPRIRLGIEYDARGRVVAYYIRRTHPGDTKDYSTAYDRVSADRVLHVFEKHFAGQSRGLPWMTRVLNRVKDSKDFGEATLIAAQVAACFAVFVKGGNPYTQAANSTVATGADGQRLQEVRPGGIHYTGEGEVSFGSPAPVGGQFGSFMEWNDRQKAAGMAMPYEMLARNWSGLSFAAGRLSLADARLFVRSQQKLLVERLLSPIWSRMVQEAVIVGAIDVPAQLYRRLPWLIQAHEWGRPAWPYALTPGEEVKAAVLAIDNNLLTKQQYISDQGGYWEDTFIQRGKERAMENANEIAPGAAQVDPAEVDAAAQAAMQDTGAAA